MAIWDNGWSSDRTRSNSRTR